MSDVATRAIEMLRQHIRGIVCTRTAAEISSVVAKRLDIAGKGRLFPKFVSYPNDPASIAALRQALEAELRSDKRFARYLAELVGAPASPSPSGLLPSHAPVTNGSHPTLPRGTGNGEPWSPDRVAAVDDKD